MSYKISESHHFVEQLLNIVVDSVWSLPLVLCLIGLGVFFSLQLRLIQLRGFFHAIQIVLGKYNSKDDPGEINHFRTFTTALSTTTGLGNIAGVPVAIQLGGPGAVFWIFLFGILGMALKYAECTLSLMYRRIDENRSLAGPMQYMVNGLGPSWRFLATAFAIMCFVDIFTAGNLFQSNQIASILYVSFSIPHIVTGVILAFIAGLVIIGGIQRIGLFTSFVVPVMGGLYFFISFFVVCTHYQQIPNLISLILSDAWTGTATLGGFSGIAVAEAIKQGVRRAVFVSEAGVGISTFAHGASKTKEPVREGLVALLEPFVSAVVMCSLTAFVILLSGVWTSYDRAGVNVTAMGFDSLLPYFGSIGLPIIVVFIAYSGLLACSYSGEIVFRFLLGDKIKWLMFYKIIFCLVIIVGAVWPFRVILNLADIVIGLMLMMNMTAVCLLFPQLKKVTEDYFRKLHQGHF